MRTFVCRGREQLQAAANVIAGLTPTKPWRIELLSHRAKRTHEQNALLWAIYTEIASGTGHTPDDIHEACKKMFLPPRTIVMGDNPVNVAGSTSKLDTLEFSQYVEQVQAWAAAELGVVV